MSKPCEKFLLKVLGSYIKITTSFVKINAIVQEVSFTYLLKNHKMLPGYQPFFSLISKSYKRLRNIFFLEILS